MGNPNELSNEQSSEEERRSIDAKVKDLLSRTILKEKVAYRKTKFSKRLNVLWLKSV